MSLYDDIGLDKKDIGEAKSDVSGWSSGYKLLQSHAKSKKPAAPSFQKRRPGTIAPVVDLTTNSSRSAYATTFNSSAAPPLGDGEIRFNHITGKMESGPPPQSYAQFGAAVYTGSPFAGMSQEYDPLYPNEYADFSKRLKEQRSVEKETERLREEEDKAKKREDERQKRLEKMEAFKPPTTLYNEPPKIESTKRLTLYDTDSDEDENSKSEERGGATFAPPPALMEEGRSSPPAPAVDEMGFVIGGKGGSVASKIMAKMGYRHGSGLGRDEQGMSMALQVEKTSKRGGKILHEKDILTKDTQPSASSGPVKADTGITNTELLRNPSKVLLLLNMVGPGEVDDLLEPETAEECAKYGKVVKCVIFEMPNAADNEAVRIFVEFDKISFAIKAAIDLNGRFFGGRVVRAAFYAHDKFLNLQLADDPL